MNKSPLGTLIARGRSYLLLGSLLACPLFSPAGQSDSNPDQPGQQEVLVLSRVPGKVPRLSSAAKVDRSISTATNFCATSVTMTSFASHLAMRLPHPVVNETGLVGRFQIELTWESTKPEAIIQAVREQLGLDLRIMRRNFESKSLAHESSLSWSTQSLFPGEQTSEIIPH